MSKPTIFARLAKFDENTGYFEAIAADETQDMTKEIFDYDKSKPNFQAWSGLIEKATDGKSVGNVRAMHGKVSAGILKKIDFDDEHKAIKVSGLVVDANEKVKMAAGCYTGVSIGGDYGEIWPDPVLKGVNRYEAKPIEISIVDIPCNPSATFTVVKADNSQEMRKFAPRDNVPAPADEITITVSAMDPDTIRKMLADNPDLLKMTSAALAKAKPPKPAVTEPTGPAYLGKLLDNATTIRAGWAHINKAENAAKLGDKLAETKAVITKAWAEKIDAAGPPSAKGDGIAEGITPEAMEKAAAIDCAASVLVERAGKDEKVAKQLQALGKFYGQSLEKGLWTVARLAEILSSLDYVIDDTTYEADFEDDDSTVPAQLRSAAASVGQVLLAMAHEELEEAFGVADSKMELSAKAVVTKFATRRKDTGPTLSKRATDAEAQVVELQKAATASGERVKALEKELGEGHALMHKAAETIEDQKRVLTKIMAEPSAKKPAMFAMNKADDALPLPGEQTDDKPLVKSDGTPDLVRMALRKALSRPIVQT